MLLLLWQVIDVKPVVFVVYNLFLGIIVFGGVTAYRSGCGAEVYITPEELPGVDPSQQFVVGYTGTLSKIGLLAFLHSHELGVEELSVPWVILASDRTRFDFATLEVLLSAQVRPAASLKSV